MSFIQSGIYEQMKYTRSVLESDLFTLAAFATLFWRLRIFLAGWNKLRSDSDQSDREVACSDREVACTINLVVFCMYRCIIFLFPKSG